MNILLAHGSSDASYAEQLDMLANKVSGLLGESVGVSFLDGCRLPGGARVLPLLLGEGKHVREDLPKLAAISDCTLLPPLGSHAQAIAGFAYDLATQETRRINALFALYRFRGFEALTAALTAQNKRCSLVALASLHSQPSVQAVLQHWQEQGIGPITLQAMLLFEGRTLDRLRAIATGFKTTIAPVLSKHEAFATLVADCLKEQA